MASDTNRYPELASYRQQIQLANRRFRWPNVYLFDIQTSMAYATKFSHDSGARLSDVDTTLYATVLGSSVLRPNPRQCSRCKSIDNLVKDCAFPASEQTEDKTTGNEKNSPWKYAKWYPPPAKKDTTSLKEMPVTREPTANASLFGSLVGGTTPRKICPPSTASSLPVSN